MQNENKQLHSINERHNEKFKNLKKQLSSLRTNNSDLIDKIKQLRTNIENASNFSRTKMSDFGLGSLCVRIIKETGVIAVTKKNLSRNKDLTWKTDIHIKEQKEIKIIHTK